MPLCPCARFCSRADPRVAQRAQKAAVKISLPQDGNLVERPRGDSRPQVKQLVDYFLFKRACTEQFQIFFKREREEKRRDKTRTALAPPNLDPVRVWFRNLPPLLYSGRVAMTGSNVLRVRHRLATRFTGAASVARQLL